MNSIESMMIFLVIELIVILFLIVIARMKIGADKERKQNDILQADNLKLQESYERIRHLNQQNEQYKYAILHNSQWLHCESITWNIMTACSVDKNNTDVSLSDILLPGSYEEFLKCFAER